MPYSSSGGTVTALSSRGRQSSSRAITPYPSRWATSTSTAGPIYINPKTGAYQGAADHRISGKSSRLLGFSRSIYGTPDVGCLAATPSWDRPHPPCCALADGPEGRDLSQRVKQVTRGSATGQWSAGRACSRCRRLTWPMSVDPWGRAWPSGRRRLAHRGGSVGPQGLHFANPDGNEVIRNYRLCICEARIGKMESRTPFSPRNVRCPQSCSAPPGRTAVRKGRAPDRVDRVAIEGGFLPWLHASPAASAVASFSSVAC